VLEAKVVTVQALLSAGPFSLVSVAVPVQDRKRSKMAQRGRKQICKKGLILLAFSWCLQRFLGLVNQAYKPGVAGSKPAPPTNKITT